jgi:hypothetical protein
LTAISTLFPKTGPHLASIWPNPSVKGRVFAGDTGAASQDKSKQPL